MGDQDQGGFFPTDLTSPLSDAKLKALALMPIPSSILSILGSVAIISMARRSGKHKHWTPYTRLLIGLSVSDIVLSIHLMTANFMRPEESSYRIWAYGNSATCSLSGFLTQLNFSAILYNSMLSFYFLLLSRLGISNRNIARRYEPWMHIVSIGFPLLTASAGAIVGIYDEPTGGMRCYINNYPRNCGDSPGQTGETCLSATIGIIVGGLPWIFSFLSIVINNTIIFIFVRKKTKGGNRSTSRSNTRSNKRGNKSGSATTNTTKNSRATTNSTMMDIKLQKKQEQQQQQQQQQPDENLSPKRQRQNNHLRFETSMNDGHNSYSLTSQQQSQQEQQGQNTQKSSSSSGMDIGSIHLSLSTSNDDVDRSNHDDSFSLHSSTDEQDEEGDLMNRNAILKKHNNDIRSNSNQRRGRSRAPLSAKTIREQHRRLRLVRSQALLFVMSYLLSMVWWGLVMVLEAGADTDEDEYEMIQDTYWVQLCNATFSPLQGFFNMLIFMRPKFIQIRSQFPKESRLWAFWRTLRGDSVMPQHSKRSQQEQQQATREADAEKIRKKTRKKALVKAQAIAEVPSSLTAHNNNVENKEESNLKNDEMEQSDTFHKILTGRLDKQPKLGGGSAHNRSSFPIIKKGSRHFTSDEEEQEEDRSKLKSLSSSLTSSSSMKTSMIGIQPRRIHRDKSRQSSYAGRSSLESINELSSAEYGIQ